jgi:hypothetical protein
MPALDRSDRLAISRAVGGISKEGLPLSSTAGFFMRPAMADEVRAVVDEAVRAVRIVFPPLEKLTDEEARAALERALDLRREWERKGYVL